MAIRGDDEPVKFLHSSTGAVVATLPISIPGWGSAFVPNRDVFVASTNLTRPDVKGDDGLTDIVAYDIVREKVTAAFRGHEKVSLRTAVSGDGDWRFRRQYPYLGFGKSQMRKGENDKDWWRPVPLKFDPARCIPINSARDSNSVVHVIEIATKHALL